MLSSFISQIIEALQFEFIRNAIIAGSFIAITCAIIGVFLVLRKFSMIGDGLAHVSLSTVALGLLLGVSPIYISIPLVIIASLLILRLTEKTAIWGDSAIAFVSSVSVASAVMIASLSNGFNVDLFSYLFGSILAISSTEVWLSVGLSIVTIIIISLNYHELFALTFDEQFAQVTGVKTKLLNNILVSLTGVVVVLGVRVVGTMLVSSLIVIPVISALQIGIGFKRTIIIAAGSSLFSVVCGILISYVADTPAGATIVLINSALFLGAFGLNRIRS